jgi:hypothetical protein
LNQFGASVVLTLLTGATSATAQSISLEQSEAFLHPWQWATQSPVERSNFALPPAEQYSIEGTRALQRGLMVGTKVGPAATIGLGVMSTKPRKSALSPDPVTDGRARGSRRAAVRLIMKF